MKLGHDMMLVLLLVLVWSWQARRSDLDLHRHVNNVTYVTWMTEVSGC